MKLTILEIRPRRNDFRVTYSIKGHLKQLIIDHCDLDWYWEQYWQKSAIDSFENDQHVQTYPFELYKYDDIIDLPFWDLFLRDAAEYFAKDREKTLDDMYSSMLKNF